MKLIIRFLYVSIVGLLTLTSCAKEQTESYEKYENQSLLAWMTQNRNELLENYQEQGDYYVDVLEVGKEGVSPISSEECWVSYDFSGRDLNGNYILTRNASEAYLVGTFTKYTRYVPFYRYCGLENTGLMEGTYLAMRNKLTLGEAYFNRYKDERGFESREILLREGAKVVLYMPSRVVGNGLEGSGGYEGQYTLSSGRPLIVTMEIRDTVKNPLELEGTDVDAFCETNGGLQIYNKSKDDDTESNPIPDDVTDPKHPYNSPERWVSASDTVAQLYINYRYNPKTDKLTFPNPYNVGYEPYDDWALEQKISDALVKRFHVDSEYKGVKELKADSVKLTGTAKIWYIGRFLDGFIFDTNIDEVKKLIYGEVKSKGTVLSYTPESGGLIQAFYYTVPHLQYGQWAEFITTSTYAYGASGKNGATNTSTSGGSSNYLDYSNYLNYANGYYGNSGIYGGYYGDYYGGYGGGMYNNYYGSSYDNTPQVTTTTVNTEIPAFTPLIFQFYIEPKK